MKGKYRNEKAFEYVVHQSDVYLSLDGSNVVLLKEQEAIGRLPLHNLESIVTFGYTGASPALMGYCAERNISIAFFYNERQISCKGNWQKQRECRVEKKKQYRLSDDEGESAQIARNFIVGKIYNNKWCIERMTRDYPLRIDVSSFKEISQHLTSILLDVRECNELERLRGLEGKRLLATIRFLIK